ncbi:hypothetical protein STSP2_03279 [Anaerohalosphaera lusitana]|uniref:Uncharacterized protein n=1 Tax=Anaerohalosphaera lusitana TaxID=1936003 RepID=A0A1U9NQM2_9BACT|nr:hypothetical protein [Anaerohalosphaera lusitana]AQT70077.1 hypothetical protein STSP2_03279 [Anaerohalosphaera lusitana]
MNKFISPLAGAINLTEEEGFEPPEACASAVFKTATANTQGVEDTGLTAIDGDRLQTSLQIRAACELPLELAEVIRAWPELPEHVRLAVMALVRSAVPESSG